MRLLPPQDGAEQNGGSVGHAAQAEGRPPGRFGAYLVHHVTVQVGLAYPEEGKENDNVAPDGDEISGYNYFYLNYFPILRLVKTKYKDRHGVERIR